MEVFSYLENRALENAYEEVSMFDSIDETTSLVGKTGKIIQSRKRNFDELSNDDNKSKKVHAMPGVRIVKEYFQK